MRWLGKGRGPFLSGTPQGVGGLAPRPRPLPDEEFYSASRYLLLDGLQIPGNVGALARACAAFGVERLVAMYGTADPFGPGSVRGSAGYVFAQPVGNDSRERTLARLAERKIPVLAAETRGGIWPPPPVELGAGWALLLGAETRGPRGIPKEAIRLTIPLARDVESLGVAAAGAILLANLSPGAVRNAGAGAG